MTQIAATDDALIRLLEGCDLPGVTVMSAPHSWDSGYIQRLLTVTPAVLVAFVGAEPYADTATSTTLALEGKWSCIAVTGWKWCGPEGAPPWRGRGPRPPAPRGRRDSRRDPQGAERRPSSHFARRGD